MSFAGQIHQSQDTAQFRGGLILGTGVMTMDGEIPVEYLAAGDRILTRAGARRLVAITVRVVHNTEMVYIGAGTLGHDRPCAQTVLPKNQMILIRDWRAKALYGAAQVMVAASRLADGDMIRIETVPEARIFTLQFEADAIIYAGGLEVAALRETVSV